MATTPKATMEAYAALRAYAQSGVAIDHSLKGITFTHYFPVVVSDGQIIVRAQLMVATTRSELILRATMKWTGKGMEHQSLGAICLDEESAAQLALLAHEDTVAEQTRATKEASDTELLDLAYGQGEQFSIEVMTTPQDDRVFDHQYQVIHGAKSHEPDMLCLIDTPPETPHADPKNLVRIWRWVQVQ